MAGPSYATETGGITRGDGAWYWQQYAAEAAHRTHPHLAPLLAEDLSVVPPTLVQIAGEDALADEDRQLVELLRSAGVTVEATTYDGMIHGFWRHPDLFDDSEAALVETAGFLDRHV
jgi:acetyl esterase